MTKHMFAGAVTPKGFVDFFDHIMPTEKAKLRYFLKGSSGSGKSTFIKKIAAAFETSGTDTEKFHCSNDAESLDALAIPERGICITDATLPHSRDPEIPGAIDKLIDFAEFIDEKKIICHVDEIKSLMLAKKLQNEKTVAYIAAAGKIFTAENKTSDNYAYEQIAEWLKKFRTHDNFIGSNRKLFLSAVTPDGYVSFAEDYFKDCKVHNLCEEFGTAASSFLIELKNQANAAGISTESFYCPLAPERLDYLYLPQMKISYAATDGTLYSGKLFNEVLTAAVDSMQLSKTHHVKLEEIYASTINFKKVRKLTLATLSALQ
ncbi:MAG: hypothetical protein FWE27_07935 [Defluviitaleaceae bacterium]|nr:hypothetical protein [Defluviitaleaceae bacterium]